MYLTYLDYVVMGGKLEEPDFTGFEYEAENLIDWYTFNRLRSGGKYQEEYPEAVKRCVFQLISIAEQKRQALSLGMDQNGNTTAAVASQSNDGVSISFNTMSASQVFDTLKNETSRIIYVMLNGVTNELGRKLLYKGIYPDDE